MGVCEINTASLGHSADAPSTQVSHGRHYSAASASSGQMLDHAAYAPPTPACAAPLLSHGTHYSAVSASSGQVLGHAAYAPPTPASAQDVEYFGEANTEAKRRTRDLHRLFRAYAGDFGRIPYDEVKEFLNNYYVTDKYIKAWFQEEKYRPHQRNRREFVDDDDDCIRPNSNKRKNNHFGKN